MTFERLGPIGEKEAYEILKKRADLVGLEISALTAKNLHETEGGYHERS